MIGFIIYETLEMSYTILKIAYNTSYGVYNWYYSENDQENWQKIDIIDRKDISDENIIKKLEFRIQELEEKVNYKKIE
jgi:hypothetical protein